MAKEIVLTGLKETLAGLKKLNPEAQKKFSKIINSELRKLKKEAQNIIIQASKSGDLQNAPLSHWKTSEHDQRPRGKNEARPFPIWDVGEIVAGITTSKASMKMRKNYTTNAGALINGSAGGRVFELAGMGKRRTSTKRSSAAFKRNLTARFGDAPRVAFKVVDAHRDEVIAKIEDALDQAKEELQKALETQESK